MTAREILKSVAVETRYRTICELAYSKKPYNFTENVGDFFPSCSYLIGYFLACCTLTKKDSATHSIYKECLRRVYRAMDLYECKRSNTWY